MPPRNSHPPRSKNLTPYLAFILFTAIFVFKLDVFISQALFTARHDQEITTRRVLVVENGTFLKEFVFSWGDSHGDIREHGELLRLILDRSSGAGFQSNKEFLFVRIDMQIKLVPGDSAGTVTTYYLSSERVPSDGDRHDEIDFEFLGNSSGNPYTIHTNVFSQGKGDREQQFFLWFDPTQDFHTYSILWNPRCIIFYVDNIPIREYKNPERLGVPYPKDQPMKLYSSLWNADDWATQGGRVKTNWTLAPFIASYRNYSADGCLWNRATKISSCTPQDFITRPVLNMELDRRSRARMKKLQKDHMVYDYCRDKWRFPKGAGPECRLNLS